MEKWVQTKDYKVKRDNVVLNIGDYIDYHDQAGENGTDLYKGRWQVLGVSDTGRLLIVSERNVTTHFFNKEKTLKGAMKAYSKGVDTLNKICEVYGKGTGAIGARSICIEDVDKLTGYDKTENSSYGKIYTYKNNKGDTFIWHDGTNWHKTKGSKEVTLTNTYYYYNNSNNLPSKVYDMLFGPDDKSYWLASLFVVTYSGYVGFGVRVVSIGMTDGIYLFSSSNAFNATIYGARAVVTLK